MRRAIRLVAARRENLLLHLRNALTYQHQSFPNAIDVTIASLDDPSAFPPADHIWTSEKIAWLELGDHLPRHERSRSG